MRAGDLRHVLVIEYQSGTTTDAHGGELPVWSTFATVRAEALPLFARDVVAAQAVQSESSVKYMIRYLPGINSTMRIAEGSNTYEIIGQPVDVKGQGRWHEILCKAVVSGA